MKKINLVTLYNSNNYGAMLQAYALYKSIEKNKCSCQIVQHDRFGEVLRKQENKSDSIFTKLIKNIHVIVKHPVAFVNNLLMKGQEKNIKENQKECERFRATYFKNLTPHFYSSYKALLNDPPICDGLVCGSDQIWNPSRFSGAAPFFLDFGDKDITRIAYAPSLATTKIPEHMAEQYHKWIDKLDYVSVREKSGAKAVAEVCDVEPQCVLDPTFLLNSTEWNELAIADNDRHKKFIFCYFLGRENLISALKSIKKLAKKMEAEVVVLPVGRHSIPKKYIAKNIKFGPQAFLGYIRAAEYIVTDSFHGTALSIIYRKQFCVFKARENTEMYNKFVRMEEVLDTFNLSNRVFTEKQECCTSHIDYSLVEDKINARIAESAQYLKTSLESVVEREKTQCNMAKLATEDECTGCAACVAACRFNAISMEKNEAGFWHPHVDTKKCIQCGECFRKCPVLHLNDTKNNSDSSYIAIYSEDKAYRARGSSGNAFGLIVDAFRHTDRQTVVYGAAFEADYYSVSCKSTEEVELKQLQKSKYLESNMSDSINRMRSDLNAGKKVLFCGTPCQVAGVRSVLGYHKDLLLCDFICHGTPSATWYEKYIRTLEKKYNSKVVHVDFRPKLVGWMPHSIYIRFESGKEYIKTSFADPYFVDFSRNKHLRKNCYNCNRVLSSCADLTIGDYWAVKVLKNMNDTNEGISIVRAQTQLGEKYLDLLRNTPQVFVKELTPQEVAKTFIHRKRGIPQNCEVYPEEFPMHPKRNLKGWARYFYYEVYVKLIKYHVRAKK